jgi:ribosomal protein S18 acetylase RimI-like enzyme
MPADGNSAAQLRLAERGDLSELIQLMHEHAEYEHAPAPSANLFDRLPVLLFADRPQIHVIVAGVGTGLVGYAACSVGFSPWRGDAYLLMNCLYFRPSARGMRLGSKMMAEVQQIARGLGLREVQWQTPAWNSRAIRFYDRLNAQRTRKERYHWDVDW